MASLLLTGGRIYSPTDPFADSLLVEDGRIAWVGQSEASNHVGLEKVDLGGALVTPGFVDAHVHMTSAGMQLISLDLSHIRSKVELLEALERFSRSRRGAPILGHGWDESTWPIADIPSAQEIDRATYGSVVYLSRIDVHSALLSSTAMMLARAASELPGWSDDGLVRAQAHGRAREILLVSNEQADQARRAFISNAFAHGITSLHECGGPEIGGEDDFLAVQKVSKELGMDLVPYWGEFGAIERARDLKAFGLAGDLFIDGSIGSHTALLADPYLDNQASGVQYLSAKEIAHHLQLCTDVGLQAGFHAIGDLALSEFNSALKTLDPIKSRPLRHRVEHAEMISEDDLALWRDYSIVPSVQPLFDQLWADSLYPTRLGSQRSALMNPFGSMNRTGLSLAFSSDAPVTASHPWEWIRAAVFHHQPDQRLTARAAFNAATRGGRRAAHQDDNGVITVGAPADLAIWQVDEISVQTPDPRIAAWSTDERSGTPLLPTLSIDAPLPICLATYVGGVQKYRRDE